LASYPLAGAVYVAVQASFFLQHLGLLAGILGRRPAATGSRLRRAGVSLAAGGMIALAVVELVAIFAVDEPLAGDMASGLGVAYGITTVLVGVGLVLAGVSIWRTDASVVGRAGCWAGHCTGCCSPGRTLRGSERAEVSRI